MPRGYRARVDRHQAPDRRDLAAASIVRSAVLDLCWEEVDYLSLHYYANNYADDTGSYLALSRQFEAHLDTLVVLVTE